MNRKDYFKILEDKSVSSQFITTCEKGENCHCLLAAQRRGKGEREYRFKVYLLKGKSLYKNYIGMRICSGRSHMASL